MTFTYQTSRLTVCEVCGELSADVLVIITELLSPKVVVSLPPYFQNINTILLAEVWLKKMLAEGRLFMVKQTDTKTIIGIVFLYFAEEEEAHLGYLLGEYYWRNGYATELLEGLIISLEQGCKLKRLIAGVAPNNITSSKLLYKLGFIKKDIINNDSDFYEYHLTQN